jgi:hypothetical protein
LECDLTSIALAVATISLVATFIESLPIDRCAALSSTAAMLWKRLEKGRQLLPCPGLAG